MSGVSLVIGFMFSMAWVTENNRASRFSLLEPTQKDRINQTVIDVNAVQKLEAEVASLRGENTKLQNGLAKGNESSKLLNETLQKTKAYAALTPIEGPGLIITLRDAPPGGVKVETLIPPDANMHDPDVRSTLNKIKNQTVYTDEMNIHDRDVLMVVNELYAAGAEAIAINDHRLGVANSIRCVGPTILVNDVKIASPVVIKAIGDPGTLMGALNMNGGFLSLIRLTSPDMVSEEEEKMIRLEPYSGRTDLRLAKVPKDFK
ncbi:MAG TPA: DUF881 domain-containing protein [Fimbriimonas sp.]|nr:DUF881 domain-containing protein [Fimbriimonas sp.]